MAHWRRAHNGTARRFKFANAGGVKRMDSSYGCAIERCIKFAPLAGGHHRARCKAHGLEHATNDDRIGREHFTNHGDGGLIRTARTRRLNRTCQNFFARIFEHGAGQNIFGFCVRGHAKTWHIDANDTNTVDLFGQQLKWHTTGSRHAQIDDHNAVVFFGIGLVENSLANVFEQLACDQ